MHRRQFLAALPLASGLAGCVSDSGPGSLSPSGERQPATDTAASATATPPAVRLRASYRYGINDDGIGVLAPENDQFAFVRPPTPDGGPPPTAFTLVLGDRRITPVSSVPGFTSWTPGVDSVYTEGDGSGSLLFDVPTVEADSATLLRNGGEYPLPDEDCERLATAPALRLESVAVPQSVAPEDRIVFDLTVTNEGDRTGAFLAGFRTGGYPKTVDVEVPPGETRSGSVAYDAYADTDAMYFDFDYPGGDRDYEVAIESETATATGTPTETGSPTQSS